MGIKDLLMTYEEYVRRDLRPAYFFTIKNKNQRLSYYGATHSNDPAHPQFADIKNHWREFLADTQGDDRLAMNEGGLRDLSSSETAAITSNAESGLLTWLAVEAGVEIASPEPDRQGECKELRSKYSPVEIEYYYFARNIVQWHRKRGHVRFSDYMKRYFEQRRGQVSDASGLSIPAMAKLHKRWFGGEFDESNGGFFQAITNPCCLTTRTNYVARASGIIRDEHIVQQIKDAWDDGKSIFIVFGFTHAVMQEPALRELLS